MKSIFFLLTVIAFNNTIFSQSNTATYCGKSCPRLTIHVTKKTDYGVPNSSVFEISNNLPGTIKVALYIKRKDGDLRNEGYSEAIEQGKSTIFHYSLNNIDDFYVYYINYPSNEKFPSSSEVKKTMNHGYGN